MFPKLATAIVISGLLMSAAIADDRPEPLPAYCLDHPYNPDCQKLRAIQEERRNLEAVKPAFEAFCTREENRDGPTCIGWTAWCNQAAHTGDPRCRDVPR